MKSSYLSKELFFLLVGILIFTLWRVSVLLMQQYDLYVDEAYYWEWSNNLQAGYFSKPPVIAWIISATTAICGNAPDCIRSASLLFYALTTLNVYFITLKLFNNRQYAIYSAMAFLTIPAVAISSLIISTDVALFFFWSLALLGFIHALDNNAWHWWILTGIAGGLGLMSKYTMGIFALSVLFYLIADKKQSILVNPRIWLAAFIAFVIWLPNLWWNYNHEFITFSHTGKIAQGTDSNLQFGELFEFLAGQLAVFGLLMFPLLIIALAKGLKSMQAGHFRLLAIFSLTFLFIICLQAVTGRANMNWAAPAYLAASILVTVYLLKAGRKRLLIFAISINVLTSTALHYYESISNTLNIELTSKNDIYKRVKGWQSLSERFSDIYRKYPQASLLANRRNILSELNYYADPIDAFSWNPKGHITSHFDLHHSLTTENATDRSFLFVQKDDSNIPLDQYFTSVNLIDHIEIRLYKDYTRRYSVHLVKGFTGY